MSILLAVAVAAAAASALGIAPQLTERRRARRALRRHPLLTATSTEGERVRVVGVVRAFEQTLVAPISGRTCVAYRSRVSVTVSPRPHGAPPLALSPKAESLLIAPFLIDRGAEGTVIVDGDQARFDLKPLELTAADAERKRSFLARHGYSSQGPVSGGSFTEVVLEPGMTIAVSGAMMRDVALAPPASDLAFREAPPATIRLTGNHEHPLVIGESKVMPR